MSSILSLIQAAINTTTNLHNSGNILKTEIELDKSRGLDVSKKEDELKELKTKEIKSYDHVSLAIGETTNQLQSIIDSVPKDTDKTEETDSITPASTEETDQTDDSRGAVEEDSSIIIVDTEIKTGTDLKNSDDTNESKRVLLQQQTGQVINLTA